MPALYSSPNTAMLSRRVRPFLTRPGGFNILNVPDLLRCMDYRANPPYGPQNSLVIVGDPAANGELVFMVADQQLVADPLLTGLRDQASNGLEQPTMQSDGLQWLLTFQDLTIGNTPVQTGLSTWTAYIWGTRVAGTFWTPIGHLSAQSAFYIGSGGSLLVANDSGSTIAIAEGAANGPVLCRFSYNSVTGAYNIAVTGVANAAGTSDTGQVCSFNLVGRAQGYGPDAVTGSIDARHLGGIIVAREIPINSAEDMNIRLRSIIPAGYIL